MVAFKGGAFAAFFGAGVILALPEMYRGFKNLKTGRFSSLKTPPGLAILVTLGLWLVSSFLSIHPVESLTKLLSTAVGGFVCFLLVDVLARGRLLKIFALSLLFATFAVGIVYSVHYVIGAHIDPWLIENGRCVLSDRGEKVWRRGALHCVLAGNWLHFPYSFVSMSPILAIIIIAFIAKYRAYKTAGLLTIGVFVFQAFVVGQMVSVLFAVGIIVAAATFLVLRSMPAADRKRSLNIVFSALGIAALASAWFVGNFTAEKGERLSIPFRLDTLRLLIWQTALQKASERPFFGFGLNVGDYLLVDGRPMKAADLAHDSRYVRAESALFHHPGFRLAEVEFIQMGNALYLVFPPVSAGRIFRRQFVKFEDFFSEHGPEHGFGKFIFLDGEASFAEVKKIAAHPSYRLIAEVKLGDSSRDLITAHTEMVMVGDGLPNQLVSAGETSHIYSGSGSDLIVIKRGAGAVLWDAFANEKTPYSCFRLRFAHRCFGPGYFGDKDRVLFPDHGAEELTFRLSGDNLLIFDGPELDPMVTVVEYKQAFALGALSGWFEDKRGLQLPASLAAEAAKGKPRWGEAADPSFAGKGKIRIWKGSNYYRVDEGYVQHYPHNWLIEALVDTGYPATAALMIALALWFRYWLMHPSSWAWLPTLLGFTWWLESLVNFSLWLNLWQFYFLLPAAFATAWVKVEGEKGGGETLWRMLALPKKRTTG